MMRAVMEERPGASGKPEGLFIKGGPRKPSPEGCVGSAREQGEWKAPVKGSGSPKWLSWAGVRRELQRGREGVAGAVGALNTTQKTVLWIL